MYSGSASSPMISTSSISLEGCPGGLRSTGDSASTLGLVAKETAVVVFPILVACGLLLGPAGRRRSWVVAHSAALAAGVAIHVIVRTTWSGHGVVPQVEGSWPAVAAALVRTVTGFVGGTPVREPGPLLLAGLAAVAALVLVLPAFLKDAPRDDP